MTWSYWDVDVIFDVLLFQRDVLGQPVQDRETQPSGKLKPFFAFRFCLLLSGSTSSQPPSRLWLGGVDSGNLKGLWLGEGELWTGRLFFLLQVKVQLLHSLLLLEGVPALRQGQLSHHLFWMVAVCRVLRWTGGKMVAAAPACCVLLVFLRPHEQPLATVLSNTDEPRSGISLFILKPLPFRQRHLHSVAAGVVSFLVSMVTSQPRLVPSQLLCRLNSLQQRRAGRLYAPGTHGVTGDSGRRQRLSVETLKGLGKRLETGWRALRGEGLWWGDTGQRRRRDTAGGLAARGLVVATVDMERAGASLRYGRVWRTRTRRGAGI